MESMEGERPASDMEQGLGGPERSAEGSDVTMPVPDNTGTGAETPTGAETDVEQDTPYSDESAATDPSRR